MKFRPQDADGLVYPDGLYDFTVSGAEETTSKSSGNPMMKLTLTVYNPAGGSQTVYDYITSGTPWKLKHLCETTGISTKFETGEIDQGDLIGLNGRVHLIVDSYNDKNSNKVRDYFGSSMKAKVDSGQLSFDAIPKIKSETKKDEVDSPF